MKRRILSEEVYECLMKMILSMELKPSEKIPEEKIAKQFGCSRAPIREAMKRLAHEGIITIYPNRYAEIANYSSDLIEHIGIVRVFHDIMAVKLALLHGSKMNFLEMKNLADECHEATKNNNYEQRINKDCEFHMELIKIGRNQQLLKFENELFTRIKFIQAIQYVDLISPQEQLKEHYDIVELLIERDEKQVLELVVKHGSRFHGLSEKYPLSFFLEVSNLHSSL